MAITSYPDGATSGWGNSFRALVDRANATPNPLIGRTVAVMGDSNSATGNASPGTVAGYHGKTTPLSYLTWACLLSGGRVQYGGAYATGGQTSTYIRATHLPQVLAAKPSACLVLAGTNDAAGGLSFADTVANLTAMYAALIAEGIVPICSTLPPKANETGSHQRINHFVRRFAIARGLPIVDPTPALSQPSGAWIAAYNQSGDGIHWNAAGARIMGQLVADTVLDRFGSAPPVLHDAQLATDTTRLVPNPLMLTDSNSDGVPDGWTAAGGPTVSLAADGSTPPSPRVPTRGNMVSVVRGSGGDGSLATSAITVTPGNRYLLGVHLEAQVETSGGAASFRAVTSDYTIDMLGIDTAVDIPAGAVLTGEIVIPAGKTGVVLRVDTKTAAGATMKIGQVTLLDLTTQALVA